MGPEARGELIRSECWVRPVDHARQHPEERVNRRPRP